MARLEGLVRLSALTLGAFVLVVVTFLSGVAARGAPVPAEDAKALAASFVSHEAAGGQAYREAVRLPGQVAFQKSTELRSPATGDLLAYVFELDPQGFIVVTAETRLLPVVAYSDTAQFSWEESPLNALLWILRTDLRLRMRALAEGVYAEGEIERNEARWAEYLSTEGPALADSTWGPWITFPTWNQRAPYWDSCPLDPVTGERCLVGCGATALSQILNYWRSPTAVTFTAADNYTSIKNPDDGKGERVIPIDAEGASIPLISYGDGVPSDATKAAISFAAGVSVQMCYSSAASGSDCTNIASSLAGGLPAWSWIVPEHWQYVSADYRTTDVSWQPWPPYYATVEEIYGLLQADAASSHPAIVLIRSDAGGHYVIVDGYKTTGEYHVNFGWGGSSDGWYFLPAELPEGCMVHSAVVDIVPPSSPAGTAAVFRVDSSGNVLSDAGLFGEGFETGFADVAEWVPVSEAVEPGTVLELDGSHPGWYCPSQTACSALVAGVASTQPGMVLGGTDEPTEGKALLALTGTVPVKVTDEGGPIQPGDLLVSSSTPGYAMRWSGSDPCPCALVGKALESMTDERGVISVLLTAH